MDAHYMALPLVEMLLEGLSELASSGKDPKTLFQELQNEEDEEFKAFLSVPVRSKFGSNDLNRFGEFEDRFGELGDELDNWFKGPSLCRTALLPSMTRYLGLATNSGKVGGSARCDEVEYDKGVFFDRDKGMYSYPNGPPPEGQISILSPNDFRDCFSFDVCSEIVMPDYKDWFYGNWTNGPVSITFPNEKEREYYGYEPGKYKGILGLVSTVSFVCDCSRIQEETHLPCFFVFAQIFTENAAGKQLDFKTEEWQAHVNAKVNGKKVTKWRTFNRMAILEGANGLYWEPSANHDYTFEFSPKETLKDGWSAKEFHFRLQGFVLF